MPPASVMAKEAPPAPAPTDGGSASQSPTPGSGSSTALPLSGTPALATAATKPPIPIIHNMQPLAVAFAKAKKDHVLPPPIPPAPRPAVIFSSIAATKPAAAKLQVPNPILTPPPLVASVSKPRDRKPTTIESLLTEKRNVLASFEAKFNEKIVAHHNELMAKQKAELEKANQQQTKNKVVSPKTKNGDNDSSLALEFQKLKDDMEEQKFSHEVELSYQRKRAERLAGELKKERGRSRAALKAKPAPTPANDPLVWAETVKKLEDELQRERNLRIQQLKSLEMLHFAEFREIEENHAQFVSNLVSSYQKEMKGMEDPVMTNEDTNSAKKSSRQLQIEAAAALSALGNNLPVTLRVTQPSSFSNERCNFAAVALQAAGRASASPPPIAKNTDGEGKKGEKQKRTVYSLKKSSSNNDIAFATTSLKRDVSDVSDSGSADSGSAGEYVEQKKKRKIRETQKDQIETILKKAGKLPSPTESNAPWKKQDGTKANKKQLSDHAKDYLKAWMLSPEHCDHPYPSFEEKATIMADTGITFTELNNWMVNNRKRFWQNVVKPKIPEIKQAQRMKEMKAEYEAAALESNPLDPNGTAGV